MSTYQWFFLSFFLECSGGWWFRIMGVAIHFRSQSRTPYYLRLNDDDEELKAILRSDMSRRGVPVNPGAPRPHGITGPRGGPLGRRRGSGWRWWASANENGRQQQQQQQQEHHQPGGATVSSGGPSFWYQQVVKVYPVRFSFNSAASITERGRAREGGGLARTATQSHLDLTRRTVNPSKRSTTCNNIALLTWKNALLQCRKKCQTATAILVPVITFIFLLLLRIALTVVHKNAQNYIPFCPLSWSFACDKFQNSVKRDGVPDSTVHLVYSPTGNSAIDKSMDLFKFVYDNVQSYASETDLEGYLLTNNMLNSKIIAIVFDDRLKDGAELPDDTEVKIRYPAKLKKKEALVDDWQTGELFESGGTDPGPRQYDNNFGAEPGYYDEGFLTAQTMLTYFLIYGQLGATNFSHFTTITNDRQKAAPMVEMQRFPHAKWIADPQQAFMGMLLAFALLFSFLFAFIHTVTAITLEKERQLKEIMKMMGLSNWIHWTAWFIKSFIMLLIPVIIITILINVHCNNGHGIFTFANPIVIFLFLLLAACSIITLAFMTSVFFSSANKAAFSGFIVIISFVPYLLCKQKKTTNLAVRMSASLGCASAMAFGVELMMAFERKGEGIRWNNIFRTASPDDNLTLGYLAIMLIVDTFLYMFIALYVEAVFPGQYGVPQPWNYLCKTAYWRGQPTEADVDQDSDAAPTKNTQEYFEKEPDLEPGVQIRNLRKVFGNMPAVRNLTLNMYKDQITVLLGHNGAGKTTTMSMLTGMFPPTSGTATIEGHDIRTDMDGARSSLGLCPQHNVLFDDLTVREHLVFFTKLKGLEKADVDSEVDTYIKLMELFDKAEKKSSTLSGGMKRKLCIGIAMCGYTKVVMLDEPTAGMDPSARRTIWELIQKQKSGRTILLTTHFMDEADLLGDRIAIMAGGELQCCGSSFFLKKKYGAGYRLVIDKTSKCDPSDITRQLKNYIPSIEIDSDVGSELTYLLVEDEADVFESMLMHLEDHSYILGIRSYGISLTTLEEVFMKVGADHGQEESYNMPPGDKKKSKNPFKTNDIEVRNSEPSETKVAIMNNGSNQLLHGCELIQNQFLAMCTKRFVSRKRNWILLLAQFVLPFVLTILTFVKMGGSKAGDLPKLSLSLESYKDPITLVENTADARTKEIHDIYVDLLTSSGGKIEHVDGIPDVMMKHTETAPNTVKRHYIVGASFKGSEPSGKEGSGKSEATIIAWFNNDPLHSPPLALGMALNSVYKYMLKKRIRFANHPLPFKPDVSMDRKTGHSGIGTDVANNLVLAFAIVSPFLVQFYVLERVCKSKHLQYVSGVKIYIFWLCALLCDLAVYLLVFLLVIITIACFQNDGFKTPSDLGRFSLLLLYYAVAVLPLIYVASFWSNVPSTVLRILLVIFIIIGVFVVMIVALIRTYDWKWIGILHMVLLIEPHYSLATGIIDTYTTYQVNEMCRDFLITCIKQGGHHCRVLVCETMDSCCGQLKKDYFMWKSTGIGKNLCVSFAIGTAMFLLLLIKEYKCLHWCYTHFSSLFQSTSPHDARSDIAVDWDEDSDVDEEKRTIRKADLRTLRSKYTIVLSNVTKYYGKKFLAVKGLWLGIKRSECFGLLGVNGAGKTTTFQMMTGDAKISGGDVWIKGFNVETERSKVYENIGYCPQFDALLEEMTAKETLVMFALLRGVPRHECAPLAERLAVDFDFRRHFNKPIKNLSGGTKRKVSTAVSMIGDPPVVFLDEPTAGMDPATKRHLWNALSRARDSGKCIVLTSHSMEECEALCTRLVIMVAGRFKCLGSVQHLKNKFAAGYTLTIKVKKTSTRSSTTLLDPVAALARNIEQVKDFVKENFPSAILKEKQQEMLTYNIVDTSIPWSRMFGILQRAKEKLNIEDYSLGQSSLEQVFLSFTTHEAKGRNYSFPM